MRQKFFNINLNGSLQFSASCLRTNINLIFSMFMKSLLDKDSGRLVILQSSCFLDMREIIILHTSD